MAQNTSSSSLPAPVIALTGWLLPGGGYWLIGQRARATTVCITVLVLFFLGILIGGVRVVDAPAWEPPRGDRTNLIGRTLQKPWFIGQVLTGPVSLAAAYWSSELAADGASPDPLSHARVAEIGTLYTAVAGMLNLLALIDAAHRAGKKEGR